MSFQSEKKADLMPIERILVWGAIRDVERFALDKPRQKSVPLDRAGELALVPLPPFSALVEINCQDCGGTGFDPGNVNPREPEDCPSCHASGTETILRNYLAEAFRIAADPETKLELERAHLVALTTYARQTVSALMSSEVA